GRDLADQPRQIVRHRAEAGDQLGKETHGRTSRHHTDSLPMGTHRGFILQPTYRVEDGRPVVHLYGTLEDGGPFLVRDGRTVPHFYVERAFSAEARALGAQRQVSTDRVTLTGRPVVAVEVATPSDTPPLRD